MVKGKRKKLLKQSLVTVKDCGQVSKYLLKDRYIFHGIYSNRKGSEKQKKALLNRDTKSRILPVTCQGKKRYLLYKKLK